MVCEPMVNTAGLDGVKLCIKDLVFTTPSAGLSIRLCSLTRLLRLEQLATAMINARHNSEYEWWVDVLTILQQRENLC